MAMTEDIAQFLARHVDRHEAAARLHVSVRTLDRMLEAGELPSVKVRGQGTRRRRLISKDALEEYVAQMYPAV